MKFKILILITLIAVISVGYFAYNASKKTTNLLSPVSEKTEKTKKANPATKTKEYTDPSGFKFSYPADSKVEVIEKKDPDYYSSLRLTSSGTDENLTIDVTSTKYKSLADWVKNNKEITGNSKDIKLAGLDAKEIVSNGKKVTVAIDLETLITITSNSSKVNNTVVSTFAFEQPEVSVDNNEPASAGEDI